MEPLDIFKAYDIRGTYPDQLDERVARAIGSAFAQFASAPRIVIARDMRPSGVSLVRAFAEGIRALGVEVLDAGLSSTDFLYFAAGRLDAPGAMFTASHNPAQYNGIKLCRSGARPIGAGSGLEEIKAMTATYFDHPATGELAPVSNVDLMGEWVTHVHSFVDTSKLRPLRIVADTANGMGGFVVPRVFAGLPFEVEIMYEELDGTFPNHPADPLNPENLKDLQRRVLETRADIGMAFDGDADRVFLLDEKAQPISGSTTTAMVAATLLERNPGATILYNLICSKSVPEIITERGGTALRTRVGHSFIKQVMAETDALFGGEHSGHYYYRQNYCADSGIITALIVLELLSRASQPMSELVAPFERYVGSGEINTEVSSPGQTVSTIAHRLAGEDAKLDLTDGLTADFDSWWFNLRPSNTEPLLRLNVEASDQAQCAQRVTEVLTMIREAQK